MLGNDDEERGSDVLVVRLAVLGARDTLVHPLRQLLKDECADLRYRRGSQWRTASSRAKRATNSFSILCAEDVVASAPWDIGRRLCRPRHEVQRIGDFHCKSREAASQLGSTLAKDARNSLCSIVEPRPAHEKELRGPSSGCVTLIGVWASKLRTPSG